jgi:hypothetical protein
MILKEEVAVCLEVLSQHSPRKIYRNLKKKKKRTEQSVHLNRVPAENICGSLLLDPFDIKLEAMYLSWRILLSLPGIEPR